MTPFAWLRLVLPLPEKWSPVKLDGDAASGSAEFVDMQRPRLGVRWKTLRKAPRDAVELCRGALAGEVGRREADGAAAPAIMPAGASAALLYTDAAPYKRDVAVAWFPGPRRLVQLSYPLRRRETTLERDLLPGLTVVGEGESAPWCVFELTCLTPPDLRLERHRLNVGDLALFFTAPRRWGLAVRWASVRQIAVASLALQRSSMGGWLRTMQKPDARLYKPAKAPEPTTLAVAGREHEGLLWRMPLKRRYRWLPKVPRACLTLGCHDVPRDRLVLVHGTDEGLLRQLAATVGLASRGE